MSEATIWRLFDRVDTNGDLWIDQEEFIAFLAVDDEQASPMRSSPSPSPWMQRPSSATRSSSRVRSVGRPSRSRSQPRSSSVTPRSRRTIFDVEIDRHHRGGGGAVRSSMVPSTPTSRTGSSWTNDSSSYHRSSSSRRFRSASDTGRSGRRSSGTRPRASTGGSSLPFITLVARIKTELGLDESLRPREAIMKACDGLGIDAAEEISQGHGLKALAMRLAKDLSIISDVTNDSKTKGKGNSSGGGGGHLQTPVSSPVSGGDQQQHGAATTVAQHTASNGAQTVSFAGSPSEEDGMSSGLGGLQLGPNIAWNQPTAASGRFSTLVAHWSQSDRLNVPGAAGVATGDILVAVAGVTAAGVDHGALLRLIATAERPINLTFCPPNFLQTITDNRIQISSPQRGSPRSPGNSHGGIGGGWESTGSDDIAGVISAHAPRSALERLAVGSRTTADARTPRGQQARSHSGVRVARSPQRAPAKSPRKTPTRTSPQRRTVLRAKPARGDGMLLASSGSRDPSGTTAGNSGITQQGQTGVHERLADWRSFTV